MSFAAKGKKRKKKKMTKRQTNTSHCPTKTISKNGEGVSLRGDHHLFLKNWHPINGPISFTAKKKKKKVITKSKSSNISHWPTKTISKNGEDVALIEPNVMVCHQWLTFSFSFFLSFFFSISFYTTQCWQNNITAQVFFFLIVISP